MTVSSHVDAAFLSAERLARGSWTGTLLWRFVPQERLHSAGHAAESVFSRLGRTDHVLQLAYFVFATQVLLFWPYRLVDVVVTAAFGEIVFQQFNNPSRPVAVFIRVLLIVSLIDLATRFVIGWLSCQSEWQQLWQLQLYQFILQLMPMLCEGAMSALNWRRLMDLLWQPHNQAEFNALEVATEFVLWENVPSTLLSVIALPLMLDRQRVPVELLQSDAPLFVDFTDGWFIVGAVATGVLLLLLVFNFADDAPVDPAVAELMGFEGGEQTNSMALIKRVMSLLVAHAGVLGTLKWTVVAIYSAIWVWPFVKPICSERAAEQMLTPTPPNIAMGIILLGTIVTVVWKSNQPQLHSMGHGRKVQQPRQKLVKSQ